METDSFEIFDINVVMLCNIFALNYKQEVKLSNLKLYVLEIVL